MRRSRWGTNEKVGGKTSVTSGTIRHPELKKGSEGRSQKREALALLDGDGYISLATLRRLPSTAKRKEERM